MIGGPIGDVAPIGRIRGLESLILHLDKEVALSPLSGLGELRELRLGGEAVRDLGFLSSLTALKVLVLEYNYPDEVRDDLRRRLPHVEIRGEGTGAGICEIEPAACPDVCDKRRGLTEQRADGGE